MLPNPAHLSPLERTALAHAAAQVHGACERPWIAALTNSTSGPLKTRPPSVAASLSNPGADVGGVSAAAPGNFLERRT